MSYRQLIEEFALRILSGHIEALWLNEVGGGLTSFFIRSMHLRWFSLLWAIDKI